MSWLKVAQMTGGVPAGTSDYNKQNIHILAALLLAKQGILHLTEWTTLTVPKIAAGVSIMHAGNLYVNENSDLAITDPGVVNGRVYIKISDAGGGTLDVEFTNSAVGYSWNTVYQGFYNVGGDQLMPYILHKGTSGYYKFTLDKSENKFDITANLCIEKKYDTGAWDMDGTVNIQIPHNLGHLYTLVDRASAQIYQDDLSVSYPLITMTNFATPDCNGDIAIQSINMILSRYSGGRFDSANFNDAVMNRGQISIGLKI